MLLWSREHIRLPTQKMEFSKWAEVVGSSRRAAVWALLAAAAGFSAAILAVMLCARAAARRVAVSGDYTEEETPRSHCHAVKHAVLGVMKKGARGGWRFPKRGGFFCYNNVAFEEIRTEDGGGRTSRSKNAEASDAPVWQRRILMGERCQLPAFSGLILYDERGNPLPHYPHRLQNVVIP